MKKKIVCIMVTLLAGMAVLTGCGTEKQKVVTTSSENSDPVQDGDVVEITYTSRGNAEEITVYQQAVDAFNKSQNKIHVNFEASPSDGYSQQLITQLAGGTAADVIFVEDTMISQLVKNGTIAGMTDFLASADSYVKEDDFDESVWGAAKNGDEIYGLSVDCNPVVMYYSPSMLAELGIEEPQELFEKGEWTWDNFDKICSALQENGKSGMIQSGDNIRLYNWVFANGGSVWDGDTYKFDDKAKEAFKYVCERLKDGRFVYGGTLPNGQGEDAMFMSNQTGFIVAGRWLTKTFYDEGIDFDYIPYPSSDGTKYTPAQVCCGYLCINAKSEYAKEAMEFASFYCGTQGQKARITGVGTSVPSVKTLDELIRSSEVPEHVEHILNVRATGWTMGDKTVKDGLYPGFSDATKSVFEEAYINGTNPEEVLGKAEAKGAEIIAVEQ
ncbi:ABC transporter substrate-binding protein [Anaerocolumna sp. MB42-C2]|uniref:ABC transporter substrate-binding protein n=1 Tax=Anaerocolumna sp. MB42-C2 TaxID=3070997 RepID=UPI0027DF6663|nr:sugar ABC transporter substrate-binding protein [Anaerocolumna sp. MB42-C2]WMJ90418.1 sugar ABC transporter substrate-binding protein [Anaerocolumna sp. MB42-C2]